MAFYNRTRAVRYAERWAYSRNPAYDNFDALGGDCTNFISQCLFAGGGIMQYRKTFGWYYNDLNDRAPAWTGVEYLYKFLTENRGTGPYGELCGEEQLEPGDLVQLNFGAEWAHTLLVVSAQDGIRVAAHTDDCFDRPLDSYFYVKARYIHILGVRG